MPGRRKDDDGTRVTRLEVMWDETNRLALQAQGEARACRSDLLKKLEALTDKFETFKNENSAKAVREAMDTRKDRKEIRIARWHFIGVVLVALIPGVVSLILNWDRAEKFATFWHRAEQAKVPLILDLSKKPPRRRHVKRKPPPPIIAPAAEKAEENEHGENTGSE